MDWKKEIEEQEKKVRQLEIDLAQAQNVLNNVMSETIREQGVLRYLKNKSDEERVETE